MLAQHKQYFAYISLGLCSCATCVSRTHDAVDDVTKTNSMPNFKLTLYFLTYIIVIIIQTCSVALNTYDDRFQRRE